MAIARAKWRDAFDAQMGLWKWYRTSFGTKWLEASYRVSAEGLEASTRNLITSLYRTEMGKLEGADPIYVSTEMCELVDAAKDSFQPEPLLRTDLLMDSAFVYYAVPFHVLDRFDQPTTIAAVSWAPIISMDKPAPETQADADSALKLWREDDNGRVSGVAITLYAVATSEFWNPLNQGTKPKHVPIHLTPWWFGMEFEGNEKDLSGNATGAEWWWKIVQTTMRLMQQRIAVRHQQRPERSERREAARFKFPERQVLVVRLRREGSKPHEHAIEPANYSHRFIVGGHWRNQWFPASAVHRQIWVSPYVKGPQDKPLIVKPRRAFTWDR